jgi:hypothetical protein
MIPKFYVFLEPPQLHVMIKKPLFDKIKKAGFWALLFLTFLAAVGTMAGSDRLRGNTTDPIAFAILFCGCSFLLSKYLFEKRDEEPPKTP